MKTSTVEIDNKGTKEWYSNGQLHREDGPAIEWADGDKRWYINGKLHRKDGPAYEGADGYKSWYINGKRHREDGPAIEYANGDKHWYLNGKRVSEQDVLNMKILKWCGRYLTGFIISGSLAAIFYVLIGCVIVECHGWPTVFAGAIGYGLGTGLFNGFRSANQ